MMQWSWPTNYHYTDGNRNGYTLDNKWYLSTSSTTPSKKFWVVNDGQPLSGLAITHVGEGCAEKAGEIAVPACDSTGQETPRITCNSSQEMCTFTTSGGRSVSNPGDEEELSRDSQKTAAVAASQDQMLTIAPDSRGVTYQEMTSDEMRAAVFDPLRDPWPLGDIEVARRNLPIGADAWTSDRRLDVDRLAEYGFQFDRVEWIVPL